MNELFWLLIDVVVEVNKILFVDVEGMELVEDGLE